MKGRVFEVLGNEDIPSPLWSCTTARLDNARLWDKGNGRKDERQERWEAGWSETARWGRRWNCKEWWSDKGRRRKGRKREGKARPRKISTTAGDSFYTCTRTVLRSIEPKRSITSFPCLPPSPSPPIFPAFRIARYIDGIRRSDRFKGLDRWRPTG